MSAALYRLSKAGAAEQSGSFASGGGESPETDIQSATYMLLRQRLLGPVGHEQTFARDIGIDRILREPDAVGAILRFQKEVF